MKYKRHNQDQFIHKLHNAGQLMNQGQALPTSAEHWRFLKRLTTAGL